LDEEASFECLRCGRKVTKEEYETYDGMCEECYEIEIDELDYEDA
jgi:NMD protein affecting ribosome stability and mRNA decay